MSNEEVCVKTSVTVRGVVILFSKSNRIDISSAVVVSSDQQLLTKRKVYYYYFIFLKYIISLEIKQSTLDEMVVINKGYYTEKKIFSTGNVVSVKAKDIEIQPVNNPLFALVGRRFLDYLSYKIM